MIEGSTSVSCQERTHAPQQLAASLDDHTKLDSLFCVCGADRFLFRTRSTEVCLERIRRQGLTATSRLISIEGMQSKLQRIVRLALEHMCAGASEGRRLAILVLALGAPVGRAVNDLALAPGVDPLQLVTRYAVGEHSGPELLDLCGTRRHLVGRRHQLRVRRVFGGKGLCVTLVKRRVKCRVSRRDIALGVSGKGPHRSNCEQKKGECRCVNQAHENPPLNLSSSGYDTAAPPRSVMKSRRFITVPDRCWRMQYDNTLPAETSGVK